MVSHNRISGSSGPGALPGSAGRPKLIIELPFIWSASPVLSASAPALSPEGRSA